MRVLWVGAFAVACGGNQGARANHAPAANAPPPIATSTVAVENTGAERVALPLEKARSARAAPMLTVKNGFLTAQHVFIDWQERATLAPQTEQSFELTPGTHSVTWADSSDADDHAVTITEVFEAGYAYRYGVTSAR